VVVNPLQKQKIIFYYSDNNILLELHFWFNIFEKKEVNYKK